MDTDALRRLIGAVEKGVTPGVGWTVPVFGEAGFAEQQDCRKAFRGDLNAAVALHEALLPDWHWLVSVDRSGAGARVWHEPDKVRAAFSARSVTPARALLLAVLRAKLKEVLLEIANAPALADQRARERNAELPEAERDMLKLKGMIE